MRFAGSDAVCLVKVLSPLLAALCRMDKNIALAAGSLIGALFAGAVTHPMDTIKTCMQGDLANVKYKGISQTGLLRSKMRTEHKVFFCSSRLPKQPE